MEPSLNFDKPDNTATDVDDESVKSNLNTNPNLTTQTEQPAWDELNLKNYKDIEIYNPCDKVLESKIAPLRGLSYINIDQLLVILGNQKHKQFESFKELFNKSPHLNDYLLR